MKVMKRMIWRFLFYMNEESKLVELTLVNVQKPPDKCIIYRYNKTLKKGAIGCYVFKPFLFVDRG